MLLSFYERQNKKSVDNNRFRRGDKYCFDVRQTVRWIGDEQYLRIVGRYQQFFRRTDGDHYLACVYSCIEAA